MKRMVCLMLMGLIVSGCASPITPETLKNLYEVEAEARKMIPQDDVALLYIVDPPNGDKHSVRSLEINDNWALLGRLSDSFYIFCLHPNSYKLSIKQDWVEDEKEFLEAKAGEIYVRALESWVDYRLLVPVVRSKIKSVSIEWAKKIVAARRIGDDVLYMDSLYRCRSLNGSFR